MQFDCIVVSGQEQMFHTNVLILAVPAYAASKLIAQLETVFAFQAVRYTPLTMVYLGCRHDDVQYPRDGFGVVFPADRQNYLSGTCWVFTIFPDQTPSKMVLTATFAGHSRTPERAQQEKEARILKANHTQQEFLGVRSEPVLTRVIRRSCAIPQYDAHHKQLLATCNRLEACWSGLYVLGNYRYGFGVETC